MDCRRTCKNDVHTGTSAHLFARVHWRSRTCPNSSVGTWLKGVFTLVPSEYRTRVLCPSTKCERCLTCSGLLLQTVLCHSQNSQFIWYCLILRKGRNELTETWKIRAVLFPFDRSVIRYSHGPGPFSFPPDTWMVLNFATEFCYVAMKTSHAKFLVTVYYIRTACHDRCSHLYMESQWSAT